MEPIKFEDILDMIKKSKTNGVEFLTRRDLSEDFNVAVVKNGTLVWKNCNTFINQVPINIKTINDQWYIKQTGKELSLENAFSAFLNGDSIKIINDNLSPLHLQDFNFYTSEGVELIQSDLVKCRFYKSEN